MEKYGSKKIESTQKIVFSWKSTKIVLPVGGFQFFSIEYILHITIFEWLSCLRKYFFFYFGLNPYITFLFAVCLYFKIYLIRLSSKKNIATFFIST